MNKKNMFDIFYRVFDDLIHLNLIVDTGKKIIVIELNINWFIYLFSSIDNREGTSLSAVNTSTQQDSADKTMKG